MKNSLLNIEACLKDMSTKRCKGGQLGISWETKKEESMVGNRMQPCGQKLMAWLSQERGESWQYQAPPLAGRNRELWEAE